jgi:putative transposase
MDPDPKRHDHLYRLPPAAYRGHAVVHWTMAIEDRKQGWLIPVFYYTFREILTHTMFRYGLCCPIYCCMPDHIHLMWMGLLDVSDQRSAVKFFRTQLSTILEKSGARLQHQPHDHILRDEELQQSAFQDLVEYIARNPERAGLVPANGYEQYKFTGCLVPGYPDLNLWQEGFWDLFDRICSRLRNGGIPRQLMSLEEDAP